MNEIEPKVTHVEVSVNGGEFREISLEELARLRVEPEPFRPGESVKRPTHGTKYRTRFYVPRPRQTEAGRNETCPCGSGKKYKKCCRR